MLVATATQELLVALAVGPVAVVVQAVVAVVQATGHAMPVAPEVSLVADSI